MNETPPLYRLHRPDIPLIAFVRQQPGPVIVNRQDLAQLVLLPNVATLPHGGPLRGEAWIEVPR